MKRTAKIIRIVTVSPIMAFLLCTCLLCLTDGFENIFAYFLCLSCLCIIPVLAYPIEKRRHIVGKIHPEFDSRSAQRALAIIFSFVGYLILAIAILSTKQGEIIKEMVLTYFLSGAFIFLFSFVFKIKASGHACGFVGPVALLSYAISPYFLLLLPLFIFIIWSSIKLKRHTPTQLAIGAVIPVISLIIAALIIK